MAKLRYTITSTADHERTVRLQSGGAVTLSAGESKVIWMPEGHLERMENTSGVKVSLLKDPDDMTLEEFEAAIQADPDLVAEQAKVFRMTPDELREKLRKAHRKTRKARASK